MKIRKIILETLWPVTCVLCRLNSGNRKLICEACYQTLPLSHNTNTFYTLFDYQPPISDFVVQLKFHEKLCFANFFAEEWIAFFNKNKNALPDIFLPVPLHVKRLRKRGFNQALEITKPIARYFDIPIAIDHCVRVKNTKAQSELSSNDRKKNMKNAFCVKKIFTEKHVGIIDDVVTTGNTIDALIQALKESGVEEISIFCCAKA